MDHKEYFSKPFIICIIISVVVIFSCLIIGSFRGVNVTVGQANDTLNDVNHVRETASWFDIFENNFLITLYTVIPIIGIYWMPLVQYNTGFAIGNLAKATGTDNILYLSAIVVSPVGILENMAYILIYAEALMFFYSIYKRELLDRLKHHTWKTILFATGLLILGAVIEALSF